VAAARRLGVRDPRVLDALAEVPRASFVPAARAADADLDEPVPLPCGQVTSQPSLVAAIIETLRLRGDEKVLEVGSGHGFQTALLARLGGRVWSVEWFPDLAEAARANLVREGIRNATVLSGDGAAGLPEEAPFDAIVVSAAFPEVPPALARQLAPGGRLVQPMGHGGDEIVTLFVREDDDLRVRGVVARARFVPLLGGADPRGGA
jgi:protein-L-isoaspartate(D-aspartate) O-methyltransferase